MPYDPERIVATIYALLGRPAPQVLHYTDIHAARIESGWEVLRALSMNPQSGHFGALATLVTVAHDTDLPAHDGEVGIPVIVPFTGGPSMSGVPARAEQIDSFRFAPATAIYSGSLDGAGTVHNVADADGLPSPVACRYSLVSDHFKYTGFSAQIPMIQITRAMADTGVPEAFEPTIVRLSIPKLTKDAGLVQEYARLGQRDLQMIRDGEMNVPPLPNIEIAQKTGMA